MLRRLSSLIGVSLLLSCILVEAQEKKAVQEVALVPNLPFNHKSSAILQPTNSLMHLFSFPASLRPFEEYAPEPEKPKAESKDGENKDQIAFSSASLQYLQPSIERQRKFSDNLIKATAERFAKGRIGHVLEDIERQSYYPKSYSFAEDSLQTIKNASLKEGERALRQTFADPITDHLLDIPFINSIEDKLVRGFSGASIEDVMPSPFDPKLEGNPLRYTERKKRADWSLNLFDPKPYAAFSFNFPGLVQGDFRFSSPNLLSMKTFRDPEPTYTSVLQAPLAKNVFMMGGVQYNENLHAYLGLKWRYVELSVNPHPDSASVSLFGRFNW